MEDHIIKTDDSEFDVTVHPAFASRCSVSKGGTERELYKQQGPHHLNGKAVPKKHTIRLKGKNGRKQDVSITLDDPGHTVARVTVELYDEPRDPTVAWTSNDPDTVFTVENHAKLCPPFCDEPIEG